MGREIVFYDMEFTSWEGAKENNWSGPGQYREIVQIGAVRFDVETLEERESFEIFVRPVRNPVLSPFFVGFTGITNDKVLAEGVAFDVAFRRFGDFCGDRLKVCYGWDNDVMRENCLLNDRPDWQKSYTGESISPWFAAQGIDVKKVNSGKLAKTLGLDLAVFEHNALEDVRSIAAAFRFLVSRRGAPNPFLDGAAFNKMRAKGQEENDGQQG